MEFEFNETSIFKLQLTEPRNFKYNSKKYKVEVDDANSDGSINKGEVDFHNDGFDKTVDF